MGIEKETGEILGDNPARAVSEAESRFRLPLLDSSGYVYKKRLQTASLGVASADQG
jgi:hypothetical protein